MFNVYSTIFIGWRRTLTYDDIWAIRDEDSSSKIVPAFERNWRCEKTKLSTKETEKYACVTCRLLSLDLTVQFNYFFILVICDISCKCEKQPDFKKSFWAQFSKTFQANLREMTKRYKSVEYFHSLQFIRNL